LGRRCVGSALALLLLAETVQAAAPANVSLCDISRNPERYVGRPVHTRADLIDVSPHGWFLEDGDCDAIVEFGGYTDDITAQRMMNILMPWTLRSGPGGHLYISVTGTVSVRKNEAGRMAPYFAITDIDAAELTTKHRNLSAKD